MVFVWFHFVAVFLVVNVQAVVTNDHYKCRRTLPTEGAFFEEPPYFIPNNCPPPHVYNEDAAERCLKNRTVYVMGNSIARQFLFNIVESLGGDRVDRENQKKMCPKLETNWDANSCHKEYKGVQFKYLFFRYMDGFFYTDRGGFPFLTTQESHINATGGLPETPNNVFPPANHILADSCLEQDTKTCLKNFFHDATKDDILIFSLGFAYCEQRTAAVDYEAWLRASASAFRANINHVFPGTIFRVNNPEVHMFKNFPNIESCLRTMDKHLWEIWHPSTFTDDMRWYHIDQYNINKGRTELYNDGLHFIGPLSHATVHQVLNQMCPDEGVAMKTFPIPKHKNQIILITKNGRKSDTVLEGYVVDDMGLFFKFPQEIGICPKALKHEGVVYMTSDDISKMSPIISAFPDICKNETLIRRISTSREIFGVFDDGVSLFNSFQAFATRGYDFANVRAIGSKYFDMFKSGPLLV